MKSLFKNPVTIFASTYFLVVLVWDLVLFIGADKTTFLHYWFNAGYGLIYLVAGILGVVYAKRIGLSSVFGKAFAFIGASLVSYGVAQFIWFFYNFFLNVETPFPSVADVFFLLFFVLISTGFLFLLNNFKQSITKETIAQFALMIPVVFIIALSTIFRPDFSSDLTFWQNTLNIIYPVSDTILLCIILIMLTISGGYFRSTVIFFAVAGMAQLIADFIFTLDTANGSYWNGGLADLVFTVASYLFLLSLVYFMQKMIQEPAQA